MTNTSPTDQAGAPQRPLGALFVLNGGSGTLHLALTRAPIRDGVDEIHIDTRHTTEVAATFSDIQSEKLSTLLAALNGTDGPILYMVLRRMMAENTAYGLVVVHFAEGHNERTLLRRLYELNNIVPSANPDTIELGEVLDLIKHLVNRWLSYRQDEPNSTQGAPN